MIAIATHLAFLVTLVMVMFPVLKANSYEWTNIYASDYGSGDKFGWAVGISDDMVVVGTPYDDDQASDAGAAYMFEKDSTSGNWTQTVKLLADDGEASDNFGWSVDVSANTVIVGSRYDSDVGYRAGAAYIFTKDSNTGSWDQTIKLLPNDSDTAQAYCGSSVSISGNSAIIGCPGHSATIEYAFIFEYIGDEWQQTALFRGSDIYWGEQVSIYDSKYAVVGSSQDDTLGTDTGAVFIYSKNEETSTWSHTQTIYANDGNTDDRFGSSVSVCNDYLLVGARLDDEVATNAGAAYIFKKTTDEIWNQTQKLTSVYQVANNYFGYSASLNCDSNNYYAVVGMPQDDTEGYNSGAAYLFTLINNEYWNETAQLVESTMQEANDYMAWSVSVSNDCITLGAPYTNDYTSSDEGAAYIICGILSNPTSNPTVSPTGITNAPTGPTNEPTAPTNEPTVPTRHPTSPTSEPTSKPTGEPTSQTTTYPFGNSPTISPSDKDTTVECDDNAYCCSNEYIYGRDVYCRAFNGCKGSSINVTDNCYCTGDLGCSESQIYCESGNTECRGYYACYQANINTNTAICSGDYGCSYCSISARSKLVTSGYRSCEYCSISNTGIIYAQGELSLVDSEISSYQVSNLDIYASGDNPLNNTVLNCYGGSTCSVTCAAGASCDGLIYHCDNDASCSISCDDSCTNCPQILNTNLALVQDQLNDNNKQEKQLSVSKKSNDIHEVMYHYKQKDQIIGVLALIAVIEAGFVFCLVKKPFAKSEYLYKYQLIPDP